MNTDTEQKLQKMGFGPARFKANKPVDKPDLDNEQKKKKREMEQAGSSEKEIEAEIYKGETPEENRKRYVRKIGGGGHAWEIYDSFTGQYASEGYPEVDGKTIRKPIDYMNLMAQKEYQCKNFDDFVEQFGQSEGTDAQAEKWKAEYEKMFEDALNSLNERVEDEFIAGGLAKPEGDKSKHTEERKEKLNKGLDTSEDWIMPNSVKKTAEDLKNMSPSKKRDKMEKLLYDKADISKWDDQSKRMYLDGIFNVGVFTERVLPLLRSVIADRDPEIGTMFNKTFMENRDERLDVVGVDFSICDKNGRPTKSFVDLKSMSPKSHFKLGLTKIIGLLGIPDPNQKENEPSTYRPQLTTYFMLNQFNDMTVDLSDLQKEVDDRGNTLSMYGNNETLDMTDPARRDEMVTIAQRAAAIKNPLYNRIKSASFYMVDADELISSFIAPYFSDDELMSLQKKTEIPSRKDRLAEFRANPEFTEVKNDFGKGTGRFRRNIGDTGMYLEVNANDGENGFGSAEFKMDPRTFFVKGNPALVCSARDINLQQNVEQYKADKAAREKAEARRAEMSRTKK